MEDYNMKGSIFVPARYADERHQQSIDNMAPNIGQKQGMPPSPLAESAPEWTAQVRELVNMLLSQVTDFKAHQDSHAAQANEISDLKSSVADLKKRGHPFLAWIAIAASTVLAVWGICNNMTTSVASRVDGLTIKSVAADTAIIAIRRKIGNLEIDLQRAEQRASDGNAEPEAK